MRSKRAILGPVISQLKRNGVSSSTHTQPPLHQRHAQAPFVTGHGHQFTPPQRTRDRFVLRRGLGVQLLEAFQVLPLARQRAFAAQQFVKHVVAAHDGFVERALQQGGRDGVGFFCVDQIHQRLGDELDEVRPAARLRVYVINPAAFGFTRRRTPERGVEARAFGFVAPPQRGVFERFGQQQARFGQGEGGHFDGARADQRRSPARVRGVRQFGDLVAARENSL